MTRAEAELLKKALQEQFAGQAEFEPVNDQGRYRFAITSSKFDSVPHLGRQDQVWKVVDQVLSSEAALDVSIILAYAPSDLVPNH